jgi:hypothetical protein
MVEFVGGRDDADKRQPAGGNEAVGLVAHRVAVDRMAPAVGHRGVGEALVAVVVDGGVLVGVGAQERAVDHEDQLGAAVARQLGQLGLAQPGGQGAQGEVAV